MLNFGSPRHTFLTCDLGFDLALHLQRVDEDAAVADEAGAGYSSVRLAETLFIKIVTETTVQRDLKKHFHSRGIHMMSDTPNDH